MDMVTLLAKIEDVLAYSRRLWPAEVTQELTGTLEGIREVLAAGGTRDDVLNRLNPAIESARHGNPDQQLLVACSLGAFRYMLYTPIERQAMVEAAEQLAPELATDTTQQALSAARWEAIDAFMAAGGAINALAAGTIRV